MKRRIFSVLLIIALITSTVSVGVVFLRENQFAAKYTNIITKYDKDLSDSQKNQPYGLSRLMVSNFNGDTYGAIDCAIDDKSQFAVLQFASPTDAEIACDQINNTDMLAEADGIAYLDQYDKGEICQWASDMVGTSSYISNYNMDSQSVVVAVIDTGVMLNHSYLKDRFYSSGYDYSGDGNSNADYTSFDSSETSLHATFVSGIIANNTPDNVKILPYKVVPYGKTTAYASSVVACINDAVARGVDVINICISGSSGATSYRTAINNAVKQGVNVCVSAGNKATDISNTFPAAIPNAITVSAVDSEKTVAYYSNYGENIDFTAPGTNIYSTAPNADGTSGYTTNTGTSFSTPYVTAAIANIKSINTDLSQDQVCSVLCDFAEDLGDEGKDDYYGNGLINIGNIIYTDSQDSSECSYSYSIPQGELNIYKSVDYTDSTQPWQLFAKDLKTVNISSDVTQIGSYAFYNMSKATFNMADSYDYIGSYAFYGCNQLQSFNFELSVQSIGACAFGNNHTDFVINGYRNTPAETYCLSENIDFNCLGCNHNYVVDIIEPTQTEDGYSLYTCSVCQHSYQGAYFQPTVIISGSCGDSLTYIFDDMGRLKITGTGEMYDYTNTSSPWLDYAKDVKRIIITDGVTQISPLAFYNCTNVVKIDCASTVYTVLNNNLYSADMTSLVYYAGGNSSVEYQIPSTVTSVNASAFIAANKLTTIVPNDYFTFENNVLYDADGNIVMFMSSYSQNSITFKAPVTVKQNAMILCSSVNSIAAEHPNVILEPYSVGFVYNGLMTKRDFKISGCYQALVEEYANQYEFEYSSMNSGLCGDNMFWQYNTSTKVLKITGFGDMFSYNSVDDVPWKDYLTLIRYIVIDDGVEFLSNYAFYGASNLRSLTMPLSISAPENDTVWYNCSNITTITLTLGNGTMADYGTAYSDTIYRYTPWYLSRNTTTSITIDENVKYIGNFAFRNCLSLTEVTLKECRQIGQYAFIACSNLAKINIYNPTTIIPDYSLFSYKGGSFGIYPSKTLAGPCVSTARDYCTNFGVTYASVGCSHYAKGTVISMSGINIADADVYFNDELVAVTNSKGQFIAQVPCGDYDYKIVYNSATVCSNQVTVDTQNVSAQSIYSLVGDYYLDGVVNTKDYVVAAKKGIQLDMTDFGKAESVIQPVFEEYQNQSLPTISSLTVEKSATSTSCTFVAYKSFDSEYTVTECGFLYGKNMTDQDLVLENVGTTNEQGYIVRQGVSVIYNVGSSLTYGSTSGTGTVSARFYVKYTNGVDEHLYYSDVCSYTYQ